MEDFIKKHKYFIIFLLTVILLFSNCHDEISYYEYTVIVTGLDDKAGTSISLWLISTELGRLYPGKLYAIDSDGILTVHCSGEGNIPKKLYFGLMEDDFLWYDTDWVTRDQFTYQVGMIYELEFPKDFFTYKEFREKIKF